MNWTIIIVTFVLVGGCTTGLNKLVEYDSFRACIRGGMNYVNGDCVIR